MRISGNGAVDGNLQSLAVSSGHKIVLQAPVQVAAAGAGTKSHRLLSTKGQTKAEATPLCDVKGYNAELGSGTVMTTSTWIHFICFQACFVCAT